MANPVAEASQHKAARLAGLFWLLYAVTTYFSMGYVRPRLIVAGDAAATAGNIVAFESLFRAAIASNLLTYIFLFFFGLTVYHLFREVDSVLATVFLTSIIITVAIAVVNTLNSLGALVAVSQANYLDVFSPEQLNAIAMIFLRLSSYGQALLEVFWAPYLFSFGLLIIRSGFFPKILGMLLMIMSVSYPINTFTKLLIPDFYPAMFTLLAQVLGALCGIPTIHWFLVRGKR